jgi:gliding motility-associated-like protein
LLWGLLSNVLLAQPCSSNTPSFSVDLSGQPSGTWISPRVVREGNCCGSQSPDVCIEFIITLDKDAVGIVFDIESGAKPSGALFYQIGCSAPVAVGNTLCLPGVGPHRLTFCKPGKNLNTYSIRSLQGPTVVPSVTAYTECSEPLTATGFLESSVVWNSISPGAFGAYNSLLSCKTGCVSPTVTNKIGSPAYVDYQICGKSNSSNIACLANISVCDTVRVYLIPPLDATLSKPIVVCQSNNTQTITATPTGGKPPYTYLWNNGATTASISALPNTTYSVTVKDASNCFPVSQSVTIPNAINLTLAPTTIPISCFNAKNGIINLALTGGVAPFTYKWNDGATLKDRTSLGGGTYTVTVTDDKACSNTVSVTLAEPAVLNAAVTATPPSCNYLTDGKLFSTLTGGTAPYTYQWSNGATVQNPTNVPVGTYQLLVTDARSCTANFSATVNATSAVAINSVISPVLCFGAATGVININATGGKTPYTFQWDNGATSQNITALNAGDYSLIVTDANNCRYASAHTINQPTAALSLTHTASSIKCFGSADGSINLTNTGGTLPYTYSWSNGAVLQNIKGLNTGTYAVTLTDANGCKANTSATISQPTAALAVTLTPQYVSCFGTNTSSIKTVVTGGTTPYTYTWSNAATTSDLTSLAADTYTLTLTDANGCKMQQTAVITQPSTITATLSATSPSCSYLSDGKLFSAPNGGTAPYAFKWSNGSTAQNPTNIPAGNYQLTVTDANNCTAEYSATVNATSAVTINPVVSPVLCFGAATGAINTSASGGKAPLTYKWSNGATTQNITALSAGAYTLTVTDANGCAFTSVNNNVSQPTAISLTPTAVPTKCFGSADGAVNLTHTGGISPYTYLWSNGAISQNIKDLNGGTYTITLTDANGCKANIPVNISQPAALDLTLTPQSASCFGSTTGGIKSAVTGGTTPYSYLWNTAATSPDLSILAANTYSLTLTDANGCKMQKTAAVTQPTGLTALLSSATPSCSYLADGKLFSVPTGGTAPYTYKWSNGATVQNPTNLPVGAYQLTVTDANNCTVEYAETVKATSGVSIKPVISSVLCFGAATGAINTSSSGGVTPYTFKWSNDATSQNISAVNAGTYTLTVTDANNCTFTSTNIVSQPTAALSISSITVAAKCFGSADGEITLTNAGGTAPYTYSWSNGAVSQNIKDLKSGTYILTLTDANGCTANTSAIISQPTAALALTLTPQYVSCFSTNTSSIITAVTGGTSPYTYRWSNEATSPNLSSLAADSYSLTLTDANGCKTQATTVITKPSTITIALSAASPSCSYLTDGKLFSEPTGGTAPYTFKWSNGATVQNPTNVPVGTYQLTVTDANNCKAEYSATVNGISEMLVKPVISPVLCFGAATGAINTSISGGTTPYTFNWTNGATSQNINALNAGAYTLTLRDTNGCVLKSINTVTQPTALNLTPTTLAVKCFGSGDGAVNLTSAGGISPYTYLWSNGAVSQNIKDLKLGTYTVTLTDTNGCSINTPVNISQPTAALALTLAPQSTSCSNATTGGINSLVTGGTTPYSFKWSNDARTQNLANIPEGSYQVTVTDANLCTANVSTTVNSVSNTAINAVVSPALCFGGATGAITTNPSGGKAPYTFKWNNGATTQNLNALSAGTYTLTVTDANNCTFSTTHNVTQPTTVLSLTPNTVPVKCFGSADGSIILTLAGGTAPFTYLWSNGAVSQSIKDLNTGTYTVTVTDANGCTVNTNATVSQAAGFNIKTSNITAAPCLGVATGEAFVEVEGGIKPYSFKWSNAATSNPNKTLSAGKQSVTVTDANGCAQTTEVQIPTQEPLITTIKTLNNACFGGKMGEISLAINGGSAPYSFSWSNGGTDFIQKNLIAGSYEVIITDKNKCSITKNITVSEPETLLKSTITISKDIHCFGDKATLSALATGGNAPYKWQWSNGLINQQISNLSGGDYTLKTTDANGCQQSMSVTLVEPTRLNASISSQNALCYGDDNGSVTLKIEGGVPNYKVTSNNITLRVVTPTNRTFTHKDLKAGRYSYQIEDGKQCKVQLMAQIEQNPELKLVVRADTTLSLGDSILLVADIQGATSRVKYDWRPTMFLACNNCRKTWVTPLNATTYTVEATDSLGCSVDNSVSISLQKGPKVYIPNAFSPDNDGTNDSFRPYFGKGVKRMKVMRIYSRWGEEVFAIKDIDARDMEYNGWNGVYKGQAVTPDVFVYYVEVEFIDGESKLYKGDVTVIR